ncbi:MAG: hypothetical protein IKO47_10405 [Ruminococcus sp.]|nr:hypothetical protein [Ruminococcus sp.]
MYFLIMMVFLMLCAWVMNIVKRRQYGSVSAARKIADIAGVLLLLGLLILLIVPLFR